jgi:hypothetical protein
MIEAIFAILGTILGFALSEWAQYRRDKKEESRVAESVCTLVALEIDMNLKKLIDFWEEVIDIEDSAEDEDSRKRELARQIINLPFPDFFRDALQTQMGHLPTSMDKELLSRVLQVYDRFMHLQIIRDTLALASYEQKADWNLASQGRGYVRGSAIFGLSRRFDKSAPDICDEFTNTVNDLITDGNPLQSE